MEVDEIQDIGDIHTFQIDMNGVIVRGCCLSIYQKVLLLMSDGKIADSQILFGIDYR